VTRTTRSKLAGILSAAALVITMTALPAGAEKSDQAHPATIFAFNFHYVHLGDAPDVLTIKQGTKFSFGNYDPIMGIQAHSLTEIVPNCTAPPHTGKTCRYPTFSSGLVDHGYVHNVGGADKLKPGTYQFNCQVHAFMKGTLIVTP
jgi:plastocyanin